MGIRGRRSEHSAAQFVSLALLALVGLLATSLAGCGLGPTASDKSGLAKDQTFTWPYINATAVNNPTRDVAVLDPAVTANLIDLSNISMLYSGLVTLNSSTLRVEPDDITQMPDISADGKQYTFHIRKGLAFSDGTPIDANTFAYSINRAIGSAADPLTTEDLLCGIEDAKTYGISTTVFPDASCLDLGGTYLSMIKGVAQKMALTPAAAASDSIIGPNNGLVVSDPQTLIINLTQPASYFLEALAYPTSLPVEQKLVDKYPGGEWVNHLDEGGCSGPFRVKQGGWDRGKELQLIPNPYWEQAFNKHLTIQEVDRPFLDSDDAEYANYHDKSLYDYTDVTAPQYPFAVGQADFHQVAALTTDYLGLNFKQPPFDNVDVRQAFALALNKQLIIDKVYGGEYVPTNHIVPQGMPGYYPGLVGPDKTQSVTGNQAVALQDLKTAQDSCQGATLQLDYCPYIDNGTLSTAIYLSAGDENNASRKEVATLISQTWNTVLGLNVKIQHYADLSQMESVIYAGPPKGNTAMAWLIGWAADYPDPQDFLSLQFHTGSQLNIFGVTGLDQAMDTADANQDSSTRMQQYNAIEQAAVTQCAWIPLDQRRYSWRLRQWVQGFNLNEVIDMEDVDWPNVYIQAH